MHSGIDLVPVDSKVPTNVIAIADGTITRAITWLEDTHTGNRIVTNPDGNFITYRTDSGYTVECRHLRSGMTLKKGDRVKAGDVIGVIGSTGRCSNIHLHLELKNAGGTSFDPYPYFDNKLEIDNEHVPVLITPQSRPTIKLGSIGSDVTYLQKALNVTIMAGIKVDGRFGPVTEVSVKKYQRIRGLLQDGIMGPQTWGHIEEDIKTIPKEKNK